MITLLLGSFITMLALLMGYTMGGGTLSALFQPGELLIIILGTLGAMIASFGFKRFFGMIGAAWSPAEQDACSLRLFVSACTAGALYSLALGLLGTAFGIFIITGHLSPDPNPAETGAKIAASLTGIILGMTSALVVWMPLRYLFLRTLVEREEAEKEDSAFSPETSARA